MISFRVRRAATLAEMLVGICVSIVVITLAGSHIVSHQRAFEAVSAAIDLRGRLRDGSDILMADLRGISPLGDSLLVASDTAVEFYSAIGTSTVCAASAADRIVLAPDSMSGDRVLSSWVVTPETGDRVVVFVDPPADSSTPSPTGGWRRADIISFSSVATATACPSPAGLLSPGEIATSGRAYQVMLAPTLPIPARRGAPVRISRRVRYSVYRGGDGKWYLGYRRCAGGCSAVQPVSGPYESRSGPPILLRYFSRDGSAVVGAGSIADVGRIAVVLRASYNRPLQLPGVSQPRLTDSVVATTTLRNRW